MYVCVQLIMDFYVVCLFLLKVERISSPNIENISITERTVLIIAAEGFQNNLHLGGKCHAISVNN